jgi:hypothetical protein
LARRRRPGSDTLSRWRPAWHNREAAIALIRTHPANRRGLSGRYRSLGCVPTLQRPSCASSCTVAIGRLGQDTSPPPFQLWVCGCAAAVAQGDGRGGANDAGESSSTSEQFQGGVLLQHTSRDGARVGQRQQRPLPLAHPFAVRLVWLKHSASSVVRSAGVACLRAILLLATAGRC